MKRNVIQRVFLPHMHVSNFVLDETKTPCKIFWIYLNGSQQATLCKVIKTTVSFGILRFAQFQMKKKIWNMKYENWQKPLLVLWWPLTCSFVSLHLRNIFIFSVKLTFFHRTNSRFLHWKYFRFVIEYFLIFITVSHLKVV